MEKLHISFKLKNLFNLDFFNFYLINVFKSISFWVLIFFSIIIFPFLTLEMAGTRMFVVLFPLLFFNLFISTMKINEFWDTGFVKRLGSSSINNRTNFYLTLFLANVFISIVLVLLAIIIIILSVWVFTLVNPPFFYRLEDINYGLVFTGLFFFIPFISFISIFIATFAKSKILISTIGIMGSLFFLFAGGSLLYFEKASPEIYKNLYWMVWTNPISMGIYLLVGYTYGDVKVLFTTLFIVGEVLLILLMFFSCWKWGTLNNRNG